MLKKNYLIGNEISSDRVSSEKYYDATEGSTNQEDTKKKRGEQPKNNWGRDTGQK